MKSLQDNETAFERAYSQYANMLYRLALSRLNSMEEAEDAVQDVFVKYLSSSHKLKDEEHERAWLVRVTINTCLDRIRHMSRQTKISLDDLPELRAETPDLNALLFSVDYRICLPYKIKAAMLLHYLEGYSIQESASMLRISVSAVKMRLSRGRKIIRQFREKEELHV